MSSLFCPQKSTIRGKPGCEARVRTPEPVSGAWLALPEAVAVLRGAFVMQEACAVARIADRTVSQQTTW